MEAHKAEIVSTWSFREAWDVEDVMEVHVNLFSMSIRDKERNPPGPLDLAVNPTYCTELIVEC